MAASTIHAPVPDNNAWIFIASTVSAAGIVVIALGLVCTLVPLLIYWKRKHNKRLLTFSTPSTLPRSDVRYDTLITIKSLVTYVLHSISLYMLYVYNQVGVDLIQSQKGQLQPGFNKGGGSFH